MRKAIGGSSSAHPLIFPTILAGCAHHPAGRLGFLSRWTDDLVRRQRCGFRLRASTQLQLGRNPRSDIETSGCAFRVTWSLHWIEPLGHHRNSRKNSTALGATWKIASKNNSRCLPIESAPKPCEPINCVSTFSAIAYVLVAGLRRLALTGTELAQAQAQTIRLRLLKIGAQLRITVRKIWISMGSTIPIRTSSIKHGSRCAAERDSITQTSACWAAVGEGNLEAMTKATESVLADALRLDAKARAELAAELLASLDGPADPDVATAWDEEIRHRVDALEAGTEKLESWEAVKRRIASDILGR